MTVVREHTYVDVEASAEDVAIAADAVEVAFAHLEEVLGKLRSPRPAIFFCQSEKCARYFVGESGLPRALEAHRRAPGASYVAGDRPAIVIPKFGTRARNLLAHELVHVELRARLGSAVVPIWFHEGLAASIGDQPPCAPGLAKGIDDLRRVAAGNAWEEYVRGHPELGLETYCQARAEVEAWGSTDGKAKLARLLIALEHGAEFDAQYNEASPR